MCHLPAGLCGGVALLICASEGNCCDRIGKKKFISLVRCFTIWHRVVRFHRHTWCLLVFSNPLTLSTGASQSCLQSSLLYTTLPTQRCVGNKHQTPTNTIMNFVSSTVVGRQISNHCWGWARLQDEMSGTVMPGQPCLHECHQNKRVDCGHRQRAAKVLHPTETLQYSCGEGRQPRTWEHATY